MKLQKLYSIFLGFLFTVGLFIFPVKLLAANYGECTYGEGNYGETCTTTTSSGPVSTTEAPTCGDQSPGAKTSWLYGAIAQNSSSVTLYFTENSSPVTKYVLEYGTKSGQYQYGVQDMGVNEPNQMTYQVKALSPNTTYYFRLRAGNGCATGNWSNELSVKTKGYLSFNQLDFTESEVVTSEAEDSNKNSCGPYTVKSGDNLWNIAQTLLGDGNRYKEIVKQNQKAYPSLTTSNSLTAGWELQIDCTTTNDAGLSSTKASAGKLSVNIKVVNTKQQPVEGAKVTLHSDPKEAVTDKNGIAKFSGVTEGEHKVLIAYENYEGEQSIFLTSTEDQKEFNINITIEAKRVIFSPTSLIIIGGLIIIVGILFTTLLRHRQNTLK